jgi:hypothetical protein
MKLPSGFALCATLLFAVAVARADNMDVDITAQTKKVANKVVGHQADELDKASEWGYSVTIENKTFQPVTGLEVKYVVLYKHEELGVKGPPQKKHYSGNFTVDSIAADAKSSTDTKTVELKSSTLLGSGGDYVFYTNGAKSKVTDALTGIWIRVYKDGKLYAELAKPSDLTEKEDWDSDQ